MLILRKDDSYDLCEQLEPINKITTDNNAEEKIKKLKEDLTAAEGKLAKATTDADKKAADTEIASLKEEQKKNSSANDRSSEKTQLNEALTLHLNQILYFHRAYDRLYYYMFF